MREGLLKSCRAVHSQASQAGRPKPIYYASATSGQALTFNGIFTLQTHPLARHSRRLDSRGEDDAAASVFLVSSLFPTSVTALCAKRRLASGYEGRLTVAASARRSGCSGNPVVLCKLHRRFAGLRVYLLPN